MAAKIARFSISLPLAQVSPPAPRRGWVVSAGVPRVTATNAADAQPDSGDDSVGEDCLSCVLRTARLVATCRRQQRPQQQLIPPDRAGRIPRRPFAHPPASTPCPRSDTPLRRSIALNTRWKSLRRSSKERLRSALRPTNTTSKPAGPSLRSRRYASRSLRRARFRTTACPIRRPTANPTFPGPSLSRHRATKLSSSSRRPRWRNRPSNSPAPSRATFAAARARPSLCPTPA